MSDDRVIRRLDEMQQDITEIKVGLAENTGQHAAMLQTMESNRKDIDELEDDVENLNSFRAKIYGGVTLIVFAVSTAVSILTS